MNEHPDFVTGWSGTLQELVSAIGTMRYDVQANLIELLADELRRQSIIDRNENRSQLAARLDQTAGDLDAARAGLQAAWKICQPHI